MGGAEGVVVFGVGFEVKRKQACKRGGWKEEPGDRFLSGLRLDDNTINTNCRRFGWLSLFF